MTLRLILALTIAASVGFGADVAAKEKTSTSDTSQRMLDRMDRNVDGQISAEEYRNAMMRRFDARDADKNGVLEGAEIPSAWFTGDDIKAAEGKVTLDAFAAALPVIFDRFDRNHDGQLDHDEIAAYTAARHAEQEATP